MAEPMKIRTKLEGDVAGRPRADGHPMETGQRKDASGKVVPLHFIQTIAPSSTAKPVFQAKRARRSRAIPYSDSK